MPPQMKSRTRSQQFGRRVGKQERKEISKRVTNPTKNDEPSNYSPDYTPKYGTTKRVYSAKKAAPKLTPNARWKKEAESDFNRQRARHQSLLKKSGIKTGVLTNEQAYKARRMKLQSLLKSSPEVRKSLISTVAAGRKAKGAEKDNQLDFQRTIGGIVPAKKKRKRRYSVETSSGSRPLGYPRARARRRNPVERYNYDAPRSAA